MENANWTQVRTGKDGALFIDVNGTYVKFGQCDEFTIQANNTNTDWQPVGSSLSYAIPTGYSITLTLTETIVDEGALITEYINSLKNANVVTFNFQGKLDGLDGSQKASRFVCKNCVPDGSIDLLSIKPGEVVKRAWSFRVNEAPDLLKD